MSRGDIARQIREQLAVAMKLLGKLAPETGRPWPAPGPPPAWEDVTAYAAQAGIEEATAKAWFEASESRGWKTQKSGRPIQDWKVALRAWNGSQGSKRIALAVSAKRQASHPSHDQE